MLENKKKKDTELGCDISKCKARCCYNVALPAKLFELYPDKIVHKPLAVYPAYGDCVHTLAQPKDIVDGRHPCPFLKDDCRCNIYENRPGICRLWGHNEITPLLGCADLGCIEHNTPETTPIYLVMEAPEEVYLAITGGDKPKFERSMTRHFKKHPEITMAELYTAEKQQLRDSSNSNITSKSKC